MADGLGRGLVFGTAAEDYERFRAEYPEELVDAVLSHAGREIHTAVEVGAGTGKATRLFARRGIRVTALEPDAAMAELLVRSTNGLPVDPIITTFEGFATERQFDLLFSASAWHWTDPSTRWRRAASLLAPGGVLALFGHPYELANPDLGAAVEDLERRLQLDHGWSGGQPWSAADIANAEGFTDVVQQALPLTVVMQADDFVARLSTVSSYLALEALQRAQVLAQVRALLPEQVEVDATTRLVKARRD